MKNVYIYIYVCILILQEKMRFTLIYPVKTNNRKLFHKCNSEMANLFFADDGQNYCRLVIIRK